MLSIQNQYADFQNSCNSLSQFINNMIIQTYTNIIKNISKFRFHDLITSKDDFNNFLKTSHFAFSSWIRVYLIIFIKMVIDFWYIMLRVYDSNEISNRLNFDSWIYRLMIYNWVIMMIRSIKGVESFLEDDTHV